VTTTEATPHWGSSAVNLREWNLPALKVGFVLSRVPHSGRVVEIGSGEGKVLRTLAQHRPGLELHGCDVRTPEVRADGFTFHKMTNAIPLPDGSMEAVLFVDVLEHVADPGRLLAEAARVLAPGGHLVACVPIEGEPYSMYSLYRRILGDDTYVLTKEHVSAFTHRGLRALVGEQFDVAETRYAYHSLGHFMDATFFAAAKMRWLRNFWWKDNVYYNADRPRAPGGAGLMNRLLVAGNAVAWAESTLLSRSRTLAAAVFIDAVVRPQ
jgi:SAM-dependent methyltransferase